MIRRLLKISLLLLISIAFAILISFVFYYWSGYPRGGDAFVHSLKVFWVERFFPHHRWWNVWAAGMPHFLYYPVGPFLIFSLIAKTLGISAELTLTSMACISIGLAGFFIGLIVYDNTDSWLASTFASLTYVSVPAVWYMVVASGGYMRQIAFPLLIGSIYCVLKQIKNPEKKSYYFATILLISLSFLTHTLIGLESALLSAAAIILLAKGFRKKISLLVKTFIPLALIVSFYFIPLVVYSSPSHYRVGYESFSVEKIETLSLQNVLGFYKDLDFIGNKIGESFSVLTPFVVSLLVILLPIVLVAKRTLLKNKAFLFLLLGSVGSILFIYRLLPDLFGPAYFFLNTHGGLYFVTIFTTAVVGIIIGNFGRLLSSLVSIALIISLFFWAWEVYSPDVAGWQNSIYPKDIRGGAMGFFGSLQLPENSQFRFGTGSEAGIAMVFNRIYPEYPQTRDYFANGILNDDFNFYFVKAVWDWDGNLEETKYLLDWWAVDQFIIKKDSENFQKFDSFDPIKTRGGFQTFAFEDISPIFTSTNTPAVLFIGERKNYMVFIHALAQANINSQKIIPVYLGEASLANLELSELKKFPAVFAYEITINADTNLQVLKKYVEEGGLLYLEGLRGGAYSLEEPLPIKSVSKDQVEERWNLKVNEDIFQVDLAKFSPPIYSEGPWGVGVAEGLQPWADVLVGEPEKPLIVGGRLGQGKVVWSGMNLPYHVDVYSNQDEALFLEELFNWLRDGQEVVKTNYEVDFVHPEKRIVKLESQASGVLFKEAYFPKWHAYSETKNAKTALNIYKAGPDFMYLPLSNTRVGQIVVLEYKRTLVEWISGFVSIGTFLILILWLLDWWIFKKAIEKLGRIVLAPMRTLRKWWERE